MKDVETRRDKNPESEECRFAMFKASMDQADGLFRDGQLTLEEHATLRSLIVRSYYPEFVCIISDNA